MLRDDWRVVAGLTATLTCIVFAPELRAQDEESFEVFEAPKVAALLPIDDRSASPERARELEGMATRLLLESGRYRLMLPWEARQELASRGLVLRTDTPTHARGATASLGVDVLFQLRLDEARRFELTMVEREGMVKTRIGSISSARELLDRDVGLLLEQVGAIRSTYRVRSPFKVRRPRPGRERANFERLYPRVVSFLSRSINDPSKKLALVEAVVEAYAGLEHEGLETILLARNQLLRGRAFFGSVTDEHCRSQLDCRRLGTCTGGDLSCLATSDVDCRKSEACKKNGRCQAVAGECRAEAVSCEQSYGCVAEGRCELHAGICLVPDSGACERSERCKTAGACHLSFGSCNAKTPDRVSVAVESKAVP